MSSLAKVLLGAGLASAMALAAPADPFEQGGRPGSARNRPSGSKPVAGGGAKERARRAARIDVCDHAYLDAGNHYACRFCGHCIAGLPEADAARNAALTS